jgi:predicted site-specific integrase-resolvase
MNEEYLTKREAALILKVSERTINRYMAKGYFKAIHLGDGNYGKGLLRIYKSSFDKFLKGGEKHESQNPKDN